MEKIIIGKKFEGKFHFRETCFGIVTNNNKILLVEKNKDYMLVGGGIEKGETHIQCLKREFLEESGYEVLDATELVCVDCFWLAGGTTPMESKANIYIAQVDLENFTSPTENGHTVHWVELEKAIDLLPLPYHKVGLHYYLTKQNSAIKK